MKYAQGDHLRSTKWTATGRTRTTSIRRPCAEGRPGPLRRRWPTPVVAANWNIIWSIQVRNGGRWVTARRALNGERAHPKQQGFWLRRNNWGFTGFGDGIWACETRQAYRWKDGAHLGRCAGPRGRTIATLTLKHGPDACATPTRRGGTRVWAKGGGGPPRHGLVCCEPLRASVRQRNAPAAACPLPCQRHDAAGKTSSKRELGGRAAPLRHAVGGPEGDSGGRRANLRPPTPIVPPASSQVYAPVPRPTLGGWPMKQQQRFNESYRPDRRFERRAGHIDATGSRRRPPILSGLA